PGPIQRLRVEVDLAGRTVATAGRDTLFVHAALEDAAGTIVANAWENVAFGVTGDARLVGANPFSSDAGIASILVDTPPGASSAALYAVSMVRRDGDVRLLAATAPLLAEPRAYEVRYTTDGSAPGPGSTPYGAVIRGAQRVRAAMMVDDRVVAALDEATPKFRVRGSSAPASREPFRH
ncbi:MAG: chitobiase/beta-hexosaminidase C-terminal domain-containing protein, partial [Longimicrobiales bacterium]